MEGFRQRRSKIFFRQNGFSNVHHKLGFQELPTFSKFVEETTKSQNMARDYFHEPAKEALINDGWTITHEQLTLEAGMRDAYVDLAAEKLIIASRGVERIAVEVKSFVGQSPLTQFADAMGKFDLYSFILRTTLPRRTLFIAMPLPAYDELFDDPFMIEMVKYYSINLIIFEPVEKIIVKWIKN